MNAQHQNNPTGRSSPAAYAAGDKIPSQLDSGNVVAALEFIEHYTAAPAFVFDVTNGQCTLGPALYHLFNRTGGDRSLQTVPEKGVSGLSVCNIFNEESLNRVFRLLQNAELREHFESIPVKLDGLPEVYTLSGYLKDNRYIVARLDHPRWHPRNRMSTAPSTASASSKKLLGKLLKAMAADNIVNYYQPIISNNRQTIAGYESLVRWESPDQGLITPAGFWPQVENSSLVAEMGLYCAGKAFRDFKSFAEPGTFLTINLSGYQMEMPEYLTDLLHLADSWSFPLDRLVLEVTETNMIRRLQTAGALMQWLRQKGVRIALDDFGAGYSSLQYLGELCVDIVKLDRSLINNVTKPAGRSILEALYTMSRSLNFEILAEGVETAAQRDGVAGLDVDWMQGYYFARPQPIEQLTNFKWTP